MRGQQALDAEQGTKQRLDQIADKYRSQLPGYLSHEFDTAFRPYQYRYLNGKIATHAIQQGQVFTKETNDATASQAGDLAAASYNDPAALDIAIKRGREAAVKQVQAEGNGAVPGILNEAIRRSDSNIYWRAAEAMYAHNAPEGYKFVKDHEKELGVRAAPLLDKFRSRALEVASEQKADVLRRIYAEPDPIKRQGIIDANKAILGDTAVPGSGGPNNVVPIRPGATAKPAETESERLVREAKEKLENQNRSGPVTNPTQRLPGESARDWLRRHEGVDAHTDRNFFASGAAQRRGIAGGVGENLADINDGQGHTIKVNATAAPHFAGFLQELTDMGYKIKEIGGYSDRKILGTRTYSEHAYGNAIDINPRANPHHEQTNDLPPNVREIAAKYGLIWGGDWTGYSRDPMHFEWSGKNGTLVAGG